MDSPLENICLKCGPCLLDHADSVAVSVDHFKEHHVVVSVVFIPAGDEKLTGSQGRGHSSTR